MKATLIHQSALHLITAKSTSFPKGNREAFDSIESHLKSLTGRRFYGLVYESDGEMEYYAGLVPDNEVEERRFTKLGFQITKVDGGTCARVKIFDWTGKMDQIGAIFGALMDEHRIDRSRPQIEFYRSLRELHLLLPVHSEP